MLFRRSRNRVCTSLHSAPGRRIASKRRSYLEGSSMSSSNEPVGKDRCGGHDVGTGVVKDDADPRRPSNATTVGKDDRAAQPPSPDPPADDRNIDPKPLPGGPK